MLKCTSKCNICMFVAYKLIIVEHVDFKIKAVLLVKFGALLVSILNSLKLV